MHGAAECLRALGAVHDSSRWITRDRSLSSLVSLATSSACGLLLRARMARIGGGALALLAQITAAFGLFAVAGWRGPSWSVGHKEINPFAPHPIAVIPFQQETLDMVTPELSALDPVVGRASSSLSARVLIVGFANEWDRLVDNLDLAERRATSVAEHLMARGVGRLQIVVSAREAPPGDSIGSRCEVTSLDR